MLSSRQEMARSCSQNRFALAIIFPASPRLSLLGAWFRKTPAGLRPESGPLLEKAFFGETCFCTSACCSRFAARSAELDSAHTPPTGRRLQRLSKGGVRGKFQAQPYSTSKAVGSWSITELRMMKTLTGKILTLSAAFFCSTLLITFRADDHGGQGPQEKGSRTGEAKARSRKKEHRTPAQGA